MFEKDKKYLILSILSLLLGFLMIFSYLLGDICTDHDHFYVFDRIRELDFLSQARPLSIIFSSLYYVVLPYLFNLHMNDVSTVIVPFFSACFISLSTFFLLKIFYLFSKENINILYRKTFFILYPFCFINIAILPLVNDGMDVFFFSSLHSTVRYYDHYFCFVFFIIFIYYAISLFKINRKLFVHILYIIDAFILGISTESLPIVSTVLFFFFLVYYLIQYKNQNIEFRNIKYFIIAGICLIVASLFQYCSSIYSSGLAGGYSHVGIFSSLIFNKVRIFQYLQNLYRVVIKENIYLILFLLLFQIILVCKSRTNKNSFEVQLFSIFLFGSYLTLFLFLFFVNGSKEVYNINFWLDYYPIRTMYYKLLLVILFLNCGYLINIVKQKHIIVILHLICLLFPIYAVCKDYQELKHEYLYQREILEERKAVYISDKMALKYNDLDGIAILPISDYRDYSQHTSLYRPIGFDCEKEVRDIIINLTNKEVIDKKSRLFTWLNNNPKYPDNDYLFYFYNSYNIKLKGVIFVDDEIAFELFEDIGGNFTEKELKYPIFTKLKRSIKPKNVENIEKLILKNPEKSIFYAAACRYNLENNNNDKAIDYCTQAISLNKKEKYKHYEYYILRGEAYVNNSEIKSGIKDYEIFIKHMPVSNEIRNKLIELYVKIEDYQSAIKHYKKMIDIFPYYSVRGEKQTYYNDMAELQYIVGDYKSVIETINLAEKYGSSNLNYELKKKAMSNL